MRGSEVKKTSIGIVAIATTLLSSVRKPFAGNAMGIGHGQKARAKPDRMVGIAW
jgi:hypothetical protein